jgi:hypothetical protein
MAAVALLSAAAPADARGGGRGFGGGYGRGFGGGGFPQGQGFPQGGGTYGGGGWQGAGANGVGAFSRDQKHTEYPYVRAASEEEERVLKKLNSICRGC